MLAGRLRNSFMAFRTPGYLWVFGNGALASLGGMNVTLGQGWLIYQMTHSPAMVGLAPGITGVTSLALSPIGGMLSDRVDRRKLMMTVQATSALIYLLLGIVIAAGLVELWHLFALAGYQGVSRSVMNTRNAYVFDIVGRGGIMNAITLQFFTFNAASTIGPLAGGVMIDRWGVGPLFILIGASTLAAVTLLVKAPSPQRTQRARGNLLSGMLGGFSIVWRDRHLRTVMWVMLFTESLAFSVTSMLPVVASDVLGGSASLLGLLTAASGFGGVLAAMALSTLGDVSYKGWLFTSGACIMGLSLTLFSFSTWVPLSLLLIFVAGGSGSVYDIMVGTLFQTLAPSESRGRVTAVQSALVSGASFGALATGAVAGWIGVQAAIGIANGFVTANAANSMRMARGLSLRSRAS